MLRSLHIQNIALIDQATLEFSSGLTVLTGETGAGKSILLDALGLALGNRSEARLLRTGTAQGSVTAEFDAEPALLAAHELPESDALILRRTLGEDGKSRAFVNDMPVSLTLLKTLGEALVEIHGQHDQRALFSPAAQRVILDSFGGISRQKLQLRYREWQQAIAALAEIEAQLKNDHGEEGYLTHAVEELRKLAPKAGEEEQLAAERQLLMQKEKQITLFKTLVQEVDPAPSALYQAARQLARQAPERETLITALDAAGDKASEALAELERALEAIASREGSVDQIEERLFGLRGAARKYRCTPEELPGMLAQMEARLNALTQAGAEQARLKKAIAEAQARYLEEAAIVTAQREKAGAAMQKKIIEELKPLKMENTQFAVQLEKLPESGWSAEGVEQVLFLICPNKGGKLEPLHKTASGGELSRVMLALKCISAKASAGKTMIFDEVDTGVSGAVAEAIGKRLARLSAESLVMVVTHLPQVAAFGAQHIKVRKEVVKGQTFTRLETLGAKTRQEEIARLLAGSTITEEALAAATKLLESAA